MKVLFICVENSCRSQIAEGFGRHFGLHAESAGVDVGSGVHPNAVSVMKELGIDISNHSSKSIDRDRLAEYDYVISMCSVKTADLCPSTFVGVQQNWNIDCPKGQPIEFFRRIRDEIRVKIEDLIKARLSSDE